MKEKREKLKHTIECANKLKFAFEDLLANANFLNLSKENEAMIIILNDIINLLVSRCRNIYINEHKSFKK